MFAGKPLQDHSTIGDCKIQQNSILLLSEAQNDTRSFLCGSCCGRYYCMRCEQITTTDHVECAVNYQREGRPRPWEKKVIFDGMTYHDLQASLQALDIGLRSRLAVRDIAKIREDLAATKELGLETLMRAIRSDSSDGLRIISQQITTFDSPLQIPRSDHRAIFIGFHRDGSGYPGIPPLHYAAMCGSLHTCLYFIRRGATIDLIFHGWTPLDIAIRSGEEAIADRLVGRSAIVTGRTLYLLIEHDLPDLLRNVLTRDPSRVSLTYEGDQPLCWAARGGRRRPLIVLLQAGADRYCTSGGKIPLEIAINQGFTEIIAELTPTRAGSQQPSERVAAENVEADSESPEDPNECIIMCGRPRMGCFVPCMHFACCLECGQRCQNRCPVCRSYGQFKQIYRS